MADRYEFEFFRTELRDAGIDQALTKPVRRLLRPNPPPGGGPSTG